MATLTMHAPGTLPADQIARTAATPAGPKKRTGLVPMLAGSSHQLTITGKPEYLTAKDRRVHAHATGAYFCTGCPKPLPKTEGEQVAPYRMFATREELIAKHEPPAELARKGEVHLYGFWSNDPINPTPNPECPKCIGDKGKPPRVCPEHSGGALGLLSPDDPAGFAS